MKKILNFSVIILAIAVLIGACKKKEITRRTILAENAIASVLTQDKATVKIDTAKLAEKAITMNWSKTDWGFYEAKSTYFLQIAKKATAWDATTGVLTFPMQANMTTSFTHESLNDALTTLGFTRDVAADLKSRIKATCNNNPSSKPVYSNEVITSVTPIGTSAKTCAELSQTNADVVVDKLDLGATANTLNWTATDYGYPLDVIYTLQIAKASSAWDATGVVNLDLGPSLSQAFTNLQINDMALANGFTPDVASEVKSRIVAKVANNTFFKPCYSNEIITKVTPKVLIGYLWVPGDYQGWNPGAAGKLTSVLGDGNYAGTIEFIKQGGPGSNEFKFTSHPDWAHTNYGGTNDGGGNGTLSTTGGNLNLPGEGTYELTANTNNNTWTYSLANWGLIGSATAGGWGSDQNMQFDNATGKYSITTTLSVGEIKFRKNDDWGVNFGDDGANGSLEGGGANIAIATAGTYTITLDLVTKTYTIQ